MSTKDSSFSGRKVVLVSLDGFSFSGLDESDSAAIRAALNSIVDLIGYDDFGNAELEFVDGEGLYRTIWVPIANLSEPDP